ncbi:kinase-like domain-containing protein [Syncephalis plumigaleata]|nr:kinase-like domain-containing protein [Syncephalis plumigaleata]
MVTIYKSVAIVAILATSTILGVTSSDFFSGHSVTFLGEPANKPNAFKQQGLTILRPIVTRNEFAMAHATYYERPVYIKCPSANRRHYQEYKTYEVLKSAEKPLEDAGISGRDFIARSLCDFPWNDKYCYVVPNQCEKTINEYTWGMSAEQKAETLPKLFNQVLEGLSYMHLARLSHNAIEPQNICVNRQVDNSVNILIHNFEHTSRLVYLSENKVQPDRALYTPYLFIAPPESAARNTYDLRKSDTWSVGITLYQVLSATAPRPGQLPDELPLEFFYKREGTRSVSMKRAKEVLIILTPLIDRMRFLLTDDPELRPTPLQYIRKYGTVN